MIGVFIYCCVFSAGFALGSWFKGVFFDNQPWAVYKWDANIFGFRPLQTGSTIYREDRLLMAVEIDTSYIPPKGIPYE